MSARARPPRRTRGGEGATGGAPGHASADRRDRPAPGRPLARDRAAAFRGAARRRPTPRGALAAAVVLAVAVVALVAGGAPAHAEPGQPPSPTRSPEEVRRAADEVVGRAEFRRPEPNLFERAVDWITERLARVFEGLVSGDGASVLGWVVLVAALVGAALLLARLGRSVQRDPATPGAVTVERRRTPEQWAEEAERHERDGAWKAALRCRFRALVGTLVEHGHVDDVPGRTAGEYRAEVDRVLPDVADAFAAATGLFEAAWYGDEPTGAAENRRFRDLADEVTRASGRRRAVDTSRAAEAEAVPA